MSGGTNVKVVCRYFGLRPDGVNCECCPLFMRCSVLTIRLFAAERGMTVSFVGDKESFNREEWE